MRERVTREAMRSLFIHVCEQQVMATDMSRNVCEQQVMATDMSRKGETMIQELKFEKDDVIAVIAPHPDDECLGAFAALHMVPGQTDIYVISDGSHGNHQKSFEEEAVIRRRQFDAEMDYVKPRRAVWLGYEDTTLPGHYEAADQIDFTLYTKVFLPWHKSPHADHRAACEMCCMAMKKQKAAPDCYIYEVFEPFHQPTHFIDITDSIDEKRRLIEFHEDQIKQRDSITSLNRLRGEQLFSWESVKYAECYLKVDPYDIV